MIYRDFKGEKLSLLGFGTMRLPVLEDGKTIDQDEVNAMTDYAIEHGVNYFDTAYPYQGGMSEISIGKALARHPRESFKLATKYPGHQISSILNPKDTFNEQLKKCGVDYFDYYLLHNVSEFSLDDYMSDEKGYCAYFVEMKKQGKIKHLGFSIHTRVENMRPFLDKYGQYMEFCQIQLNYVDWTLQKAKEKMELLREYNMPVWVMEPVRGGKIASNGVENGFRWVMQFPEVKMILSGMSNLEQMKQNVEIFSKENPTTEAENEELYKFAEEFSKSVPCTACGYCTKFCPNEIDIPVQIKIYNEAKVVKDSLNVVMQHEAIPAEHQCTACIACGACVKQCPQGIDIPFVMKDLGERVAKMTSWSQTCKNREAAAKKLLGLE